MPDPIFNKLSAYLDGELNEREAAAVEAHIETCAECRSGLDELRRLSALLDGSPEPDFTPVQDFRSQLMLQLPRRDESSRPVPEAPFLIWSAPVMVVIVLVFIQITTGISSLVNLANRAGLLNGSAGWAAAAPRQMVWFTAIQTTGSYIADIPNLPALQFLNSAGVLSWDLFINLLLQITAAVIYWGLLGFIWRRGNNPFTAK